MSIIPKFSFCIVLIGLWLSQAIAFDVPSLTGPVVDQAGLLSPQENQSISEKIRQHKNSGSEQIQVLILKSLNDEAIEEVAIRTFDQWKLGDQKKDDGVLFIVSINDRKLRIEVGQGLEGAIPDIIAKRIISEITKPIFKSQNYYLGILLTVEAIHQASVIGQQGKIFHVEDFKAQLQNDPNLLNSQEKQYLDQSDAPTGKKKLPVGIIVLFLIGLWFVILLISPSTALWILYALMSGGRGGYGGGSGGGWSGGGGSSSGGGASGDW